MSKKNSPEKQEFEKTEDIISAEFDRLQSGETQEEEAVHEEVEVSEENHEEVAEQDASEEQVTEEVSDTVKDEIQEAADSDYTEPAPERWPTEIKEVYNSLPPAARKAMLDGIYKPMQRQYTQATQDLARQRAVVDPMMKILEQHRSTLERSGTDPIEALKNQFAWLEHFNRVGPEQGIADMRAAWGLDRTEEGQSQEGYMTPVERAMKQKLDQLTQYVENQHRETLQQKQAREQQEQQRQMQNVQQGLMQFVTEQNDGKPAHPYVERVAPAMAGIIRGGLVKSVDEYGSPVPIRDQVEQAYRMACNLDPSIRDSQPVTRQVARVKAAQNVGSVNSGPVKKGADQSLPISDFIEKTYDSLSRRAG